MNSLTMSEKMLLAGLLCIVLSIMGGSTAWARIPPGADCLDCHTDTEGTLKSEYQGEDGCVYCHSHSQSSTYYTLNPEDDPYDVYPEIIVPVTVYTGATAPTEFLASGNFWWVKGPADGIPGSPYNFTGGGYDLAGHNIFPNEPDERWLSTTVPGAPGDITGCRFPGSCHYDLNTNNYMYGARRSCLKCHMMDSVYPSGWHHAEDECTERDENNDCVPGTEIYVVGANIQVPSDPAFDGFYRFLSGHFAGGAHGVAGIEDDDWEATVSPTDHNEYHGDQRDLNSPTSIAGVYPRGHTSTGYCVGCHGAFHISSVYVDGIVPCPPESEEETCYEWVRHPVDFVLPDSGDYDFHLYTEYNPLVPMGRPDFDPAYGPYPSDKVTPGRDVINCLTCHRAHGTPGGQEAQNKHLRWDPLHEGGSCTTCHLSKTHTSQEYYLCDQIKDCNSCHTSHGHSNRYSDRPGWEQFGPNENEKLVWDVIELPPYDDENVEWKDPCTYPIPIIPPGDSRFVRNADPWDGICEVCHTQTLYWLNDGSQLVDHHVGPAPEDVCTECHEHEVEFSPMPGNPGHTLHEGGAMGPAAMGCSCHDSFPMEAGQLDDMILGNVCDTCHSEGGSFNGVALLTADNWTNGVYDAGQPKAGNENWCASCHDNDPAIIDGATAPNIAGDNSTYGFYSTGHGLDAGSHYQLMYYQEGSGTGNPGAGETCTTCHDAGANHIDAAELTRLNLGYENDQNNTNCDNCHTLTTGPANHPPELYPLSDTKPNPEYEAAAHGTKLCTECHEVHGAVADHYPAMALDDGRTLCLSCHNNNEPNPPSAPSEAPAAHDEASEIACSTCHNPHLPAHGGGEPNCFTSGCHTVNLMHAAHFIGENGPHFPQNETGCYECHVDGRLQCADAPLFKNVEDPEGPPQYLSETAACDPCHSATSP